MPQRCQVFDDKTNARACVTKSPNSIDRVVVRMVNITKRFSKVIANRKICFDLRSGEIHGLLGENGAGKTTLVNILYGLYRPDEGEIYVCARARSKRVDIRSPSDALKLGIAMVHQHFSLIPAFSVIENVAIGTRDPLENIRNEVIKLSKRFGLRINPEVKVWQLSSGEKQRVEIIKSLFRGAKILILDEPTAVLTPLEVKELFKALRLMTSEGMAVIFVTHKLKEILEITDRVTVLRKGVVVGTYKTSEVDVKKLATLMCGGNIQVPHYEHKIEYEKRKPILEIIKLRCLGDFGQVALKDISITVHAGEIVGVAGVAGNGQKELEEVLANFRPAIGGKIFFYGKDFTNRPLPKELFGYIPEDRISKGLVLGLSVKENLILKLYNAPDFQKHSILNDKVIKSYAKNLVSAFRIDAPSVEAKVETLSGGNMQKVVLARELSRPVKFLLCCQATRGLDIKTTYLVHDELLKMKKRGVGILFISEDLDEIFVLSDRIVVLYEGRIMGVVSPKEVSYDQIGLMMGGFSIEGGKSS